MCFAYMAHCIFRDSFDSIASLSLTREARTSALSARMTRGNAS